MSSKYAVVAVAFFAATAAQAGPAGSGLAHTEEVARRAAAERVATVRLAPPSRECVPAAVTALRGHEAVRDVKVEGSDLSIKVRTDPSTAKGEDLQALVARVCASTDAAATS